MLSKYKIINELNIKFYVIFLLTLIPPLKGQFSLVKQFLGKGQVHFIIHKRKRKANNEKLFKCHLEIQKYTGNVYHEMHFVLQM